MVIYKCYFSGEHIALSIKRQQQYEHRIRKNQQIKALCITQLTHVYSEFFLLLQTQQNMNVIYQVFSVDYDGHTLDHLE